MRLAIGVLGVLICLASVILLGLDISRYIASGILQSSLHMTRILELMHVWTPVMWTHTVNFINYQPNGAFASTFVSYATAIPAMIIGILIGLLLVIFGFKIRRYRY
jgi:hypothetical protein